jgi:methylenetetrahydrofolate dehydrogenase (NADP+) / methenyltetrahydrofolate cyclohydrolase
LKAKLLDGIVVASSIKSDLKKKVKELKMCGIDPCLSTILVGDDVGSATYIRNKHKAASEVGITALDYRFSNDLKEVELIELINSLNKNDKVHGILVQLPLPHHINESNIIECIKPSKDVDGLTPYNSGRLLNGTPLLMPCTPTGIMEILNYYALDVSGLDAIVVNRSNLVGKPLTFLLLERNATVTICHSQTKGLANKLRSADIVISAVGKRSEFVIDGSMIRVGSIIIDVGVSRSGGRLLGDIDFDSVEDKAAWITPVPGGVGPMTIAMLLKNTVSAVSLT